MQGILLLIVLSGFSAFGTLMPERDLPPLRYAARSTPSPAVDGLEIVKDFLITSAASDFFKFQSPLPTEFRNVRIGHIGDTSKSGSYRMCGQFSTGGSGEKVEWIDFATIKTSGYEQHVGGTTTYCTDEKMTWDTTGDLSPILKSRLDELKKKQ